MEQDFVLETIEMLYRDHSGDIHADALIHSDQGCITPTIIKYAFWKMVYNWENAQYACLNLNEAYAPDEIKTRSLCINADISVVVDRLLEK